MKTMITLMAIAVLFAFSSNVVDAAKINPNPIGKSPGGGSVFEGKSTTKCYDAYWKCIDDSERRCYQKYYKTTSRGRSSYNRCKKGWEKECKSDHKRCKKY